MVKTGLRTLIALVILLAMGAGLPWLFVTSPHGGFLSGVQYVFALIVFGTANLLVWIMTLLHWRLFGVPRWVQAIVAIQTIPALIALFLFGQALFSGWQDNQASEQTVALRKVIESDATDELRSAQASCGELCTQKYSLDSWMLLIAGL